MDRREGRFVGVGGLGIYHQRWLPDGPARAALLVAHGYAEHSGRYANLVEYFVPRGYAVYALDHRGHGRSDGARVWIDDFGDYLADLKTFFDLVRAEQPRGPIYLIGHSMGAMIATAYAARFQHELAGLVLSGGGIATETTPPPRAGIDLAAALSRDPRVGDAYVSDPLVYRGPMPAGRAEKVAVWRARLPEDARRITLPILIMAGVASPLGDGPRSRALYEVVGSADKTLKFYDGLLHEIFNEPEHPRVLADLDVWLDAHGAGAPAHAEDAGPAVDRSAES